ncbi:MAG: DJ-1/PfpI family protein [Candidatus Obscuribacterales bacterium]|nr:DJ-1/PfpI family protein [Candidatus Obscuribacterales bacterium]
MANLKGAKVALVIAPSAFRDEELFVPKELLEQAGATTVIASTNLGEATGMLGGKAQVEKEIANLKSEELDALIVVGGMGSPEFLWNEKGLHELLEKLSKDGKVVGAICLSGAVLANAGLLSGKKATVWACPESLEALEKGKATFVDKPVVQDGKFITANGPDAANEFGESIIAELSKVKV